MVSISSFVLLTNPKALLVCIIANKPHYKYLYGFLFSVATGVSVKKHFIIEVLLCLILCKLLKTKENLKILFSSLCKLIRRRGNLMLLGRFIRNCDSYYHKLKNKKMKHFEGRLIVHVIFQ